MYQSLREFQLPYYPEEDSCQWSTATLYHQWKWPSSHTLYSWSYSAKSVGFCFPVGVLWQRRQFTQALEGANHNRTADGLHVHTVTSQVQCLLYFLCSPCCLHSLLLSAFSDLYCHPLLLNLHALSDLPVYSPFSLYSLYILSCSLYVNIPSNY